MSRSFREDTSNTRLEAGPVRRNRDRSIPPRLPLDEDFTDKGGFALWRFLGKSSSPTSPKQKDEPSIESRLIEEHGAAFNVLPKFFKNRKRRQTVVETGYLKNADVFGNEFRRMSKHEDLDDPDNPENELPEFFVASIKRIESLDKEIGVYRINGDTKVMQKIRFDADQHDYGRVYTCESIHDLSGSLKMFLREAPSPLISQIARQRMLAPATDKHGTMELRISGIQSALMLLESSLEYKMLRYLLQHLKWVTEQPKYNMSSQALAACLVPSVFHIVADPIKHERLVAEVKENVEILQFLIVNVERLFLSHQVP